MLSYNMSLDLNTILKDWPHESGAIKVRKVLGLDGREKLQLRIDLGVLQMEMSGRPDGVRPNGCESLLAYHQQRANRAEEKGETYDLTPEQCSELQQEGIQYYHRYLSLFQINEFAGVVRDTQRNLDLFSFVTEHTDREELVLDDAAISPLRAHDEHAGKSLNSFGQGKFAEAMVQIQSRPRRHCRFFPALKRPSLPRKVPRSRSSRNGLKK